MLSQNMNTKCVLSVAHESLLAPNVKENYLGYYNLANQVKKKKSPAAAIAIWAGQAVCFVLDSGAS